MSDFDQAIEAQLDALQQIESLKREQEELLITRQQNSPAEVKKSRQAHEIGKKNLKSDLKKTTAYVKKIKTINSEGLQQCLRDTESLNLTLYISEIVGAIVETGYKPTDTPMMVKLCVSLHRRYEEFTEPLVRGLKTSLLCGVPQNEDDKEFGKRRRIQIRFSVELFQAGVFLDESFFVDLLRMLLGKAPRGSGGSSVLQQPLDLLGLSTLLKYGNECLMGYIPKRIISLAKSAGKPLEEVASKTLTSPNISAEMRTLVDEAYAELCDDMIKAHRDYRSRERRAEKDRMMHGNLSEAKQNELDNSKRLFEKLFSAVSQLSEGLGADMPVLHEEKDDDENKGGLSIWDSGGAGTQSGGNYGPYGDAETKAFYEDLPDLLSLVPLSVLGFTPEQATKMREDWKLAKEAESAEPTAEEKSDFVAADVTPLETDILMSEGDGGDGVTNLDGTSDADSILSSSAATIGGKGETDDGVDGDFKDGEKQATSLTSLLEKLPECINKQKADEFAVSFCHYNSKAARKRLIDALIHLPRGRTELTTTYSRIIASLARLFPDIVEPINDALRREFFGILRSRNQYYIDGKIRNIRFCGELVKFRVAPPVTAFRMFRALFADFAGHNVELLSILLETCGRFLYLMPLTHHRTEEVLDTMLRLRRAKHMDMRQQSLLENAYFCVKPPEKIVKEVVILTPVQKYATFLIIEHLDSPSTSVNDVIKSLRKLPWDNKEEDVETHLVHAILKTAHTNFIKTPAIADCLSGLSRFTPNLIVRVVDRLLEEIQWGLECPHKRQTQRLLGVVRLVGELYNFSVLNASFIFDLMYHSINFGHIVPDSEQTSSTPPATSNVTRVPSFFHTPSCQINGAKKLMILTRKYDPRIPCEIDAPNDTFRIQIVCELLNTCGSYYVRGQAKEKLCRFLTYFQRYLHIKSALPMHVEFTVLDTLDSLEELARAAQSGGGSGRTGGAAATGTSGGLLLPRFNSMDAAQASIEAYERETAVEAPTQDDDDDDDDDDDEEDGGEDGDDGDDGEDGEDADVATEGDGADEGNEDDDDDDDDDEGDDEEEDESVSDREAARLLESMRIAEEDEEFERAFRMAMQTSVESARSSGLTARSSDLSRMAIPAVLPKPKNVHMKGDNEDGDEDDDDDEDDEEDGNRNRFKKEPTKPTVVFRLLSRDVRGRVETRALPVPEENPMALKLIKAEAELREEKQRLKERVLQIEKVLQTTGEREVSEGDTENAQYYASFHFAGSTKESSMVGGAGGAIGGGSGGMQGVAKGRGNWGGRGRGGSLDQFLKESSEAELREIRNRAAGRGGAGSQHNSGRGTSIGGMGGRGSGGRSSQAPGNFNSNWRSGGGMGMSEKPSF